MIQVENSFANVSMGSNINVLQDIHLDKKNIAVYQRDVALLQNELRTLANHPFECRASGTIDEIKTELLVFFKENLPSGTLILKDTGELLDQFQKVTEASSFRILLATVSTDMCKKIHTDINRLRLLCTYVGSGTMWLPDELIDQNTLRSTHTNEDVIIDEGLVQQVDTGDVAILKGALYPDANPILHRSPTIEETGEKRLLLRIDINENIWT